MTQKRMSRCSGLKGTSGLKDIFVGNYKEMFRPIKPRWIRVLLDYLRFVWFFGIKTGKSELLMEFKD
jgi:hypothetical protein